ncbi:MAG: hypothetical protein IK083_06955 [Abditibacteriota bacterium]|nr:hypothetical protein [Abditibacteriota bacterium]
MKQTITLIIILAAACLQIQLSGAEYPNVYRQPQGEPVLEADRISGGKTDVVAEGSVEAVYDFYHLLSDRLEYRKDRLFRAEDLSLFTCSDTERPHLSVKAGLLEAENTDGKYRIRLKDLSVNYRNKRILKIPAYNYTYNPDARSPMINLPVPGYGKGDGFTLKYSPVFIDSYHTYASASMKYGTKSRFSFDAGLSYGFDGYLDNSRYKTLKAQDAIRYVTDYSLSFREPDPRDRKPARLVGDVNLCYKHKMTTLYKEAINVYRMPEVRLTYYMKELGNARGADRRAVLTPSLQVSWCREKDQPVDKSMSIFYDDKYRSKFTAEAELPYLLGTWGGVTVQPVVKGIYNRYEDKSTYKALACGVDLARFYGDNSFWNLRYLWAREDGFTPFEFDSIAYEQGLIATAQKDLGKYILGGWYAYNFHLKKSYRYGVALGYKTDCFWSGASYDFYEKKLKMSVAILGF